ncbi:MAG: hypothetical protein ABL921_22165 [Pirellula sp.]
MRILLATSIQSAVCPSIDVGQVAKELTIGGAEVDQFSLPIRWDDDRSDIAEWTSQMCGVRLLNLTECCDMLVAFAIPAYFLRHPRKVNVLGPKSLAPLRSLLNTSAKSTSRETERRLLVDAVRLCLVEAKSTFYLSDSESIGLRSLKIPQCALGAPLLPKKLLSILNQRSGPFAGIRRLAA